MTDNDTCAGRKDVPRCTTTVEAPASHIAMVSHLVGRLVTTTGSLLPAENEAQVEAFLGAHPGFRVVPVRDVVPGLTASAHPDHLALTPARHDTDQFFAAVMERAEALQTAPFNVTNVGC